MLFAILGGFAFANAQTSNETFDLGYDQCVSSDGTKISTTNIPYFLKNDMSLKVDGGILNAKIDGETFITSQGKQSISKFVRVDRFISPKSDIDISLRVGILSDIPVLYWQENYQHRPSRMGLFQISKVGIRQLCEGLTGNPLVE